MSQYITPYFFQCCKYEPCPKKRKVLENIGFGQGYFFNHRNQSLILETSNGPFSVPMKYSLESYKTLRKLLWSEDCFDLCLKDLESSQKVWSNVKKRDKIRTLDSYIIDLKCSFQKKQRLKSIFTLALMLHLIKQDELFNDNLNDNLKDNLDNLSLNSFLNLEDHPVSSPSKSTLKKESICSTFEKLINLNKIQG